MTAYPTPSNRGMWWLTTTTWSRLHAVSANQVDPSDEDAVEALRGGELPLTALCGAAARWWPGVFSRLGMQRCAHCCRVLGIPVGHGTPANEIARKEREKAGTS